MIEFREIIFGTDEYERSVALRHEILRKPLGLVFDPEELALEGSSHHLCAFSDNKELIACLIMVPLENKSFKMRQFAVGAAFQMQGVGKGLVAFAEQWAMAKGFGRIELHARQTAIPFYLKLDYRIQGEEFIEVTVPHCFMYKELGY